jgi:hypothetical protein
MLHSSSAISTFVLSNPSATTGTLASQMGALIDVDGAGHVTSVPGLPTSWQLNNNVGGGLQLDALGGDLPGREESIQMPTAPLPEMDRTIRLSTRLEHLS